MAPISTRSLFKASASILVRATKYSAHLNIFPSSIRGTAYERRYMLPNPAVNTDALSAALHAGHGPPVTLVR